MVEVVVTGGRMIVGCKVHLGQFHGRPLISHISTNLAPGRLQLDQLTTRDFNLNSPLSLTAFKPHLLHKFEDRLDWRHFKALVCEYFSGSSLSRMKGRRTASLLLETTKDFLIWQRWPEHLADLVEMA